MINLFILNSRKHKLQLIDKESMCAALYPVLASTLNHSCHPNMIRLSVPGNRILLVAARDIDQGYSFGKSFQKYFTILNI